MTKYFRYCLLRALSISLIIVITSCSLMGCTNKETDYQKTSYTVELNTEAITPVMSCFYGGQNEFVYDTAENILNNIKSQGEYDLVTIPVAWSFVEQVEGEYDFAIYDSIFSVLTEAGYKLIVILDAGGRNILKDGLIVTQSIPGWVWEKYPNASSVDFYGQKRSSFDFFSEESLETVASFYMHALDWLSENYYSDVECVAPGIMGEFEIKYAQNGFTWESYTESSQKVFQDYLLEKYGTIEILNRDLETDYSDFQDIILPVIDYNNTILSLNLGETRLYTDWMECRENQIVKYTKYFTDIIHERNFETIGYFGQFMFPLDAIYATGVVAKCSELFDRAVIDYNFYDGYKEVLNADIPSFLVNLVSNLGYETVYAGLYFERVSLDHQGEFVEELNNNLLIDAHADGFEIGSLSLQTKEQIAFELPQKKKNEKSKVAIYTSEWNYYKTHGESEEYLNYLSNSAVELFHILEYELGIPVEVITDYNILNGDLEDYDLVFLPCQIFVPEESKEAIIKYAANGGKLIQDFRFSEFDSYGRSALDVQEQLFGVLAQSCTGNAVKLKPMNLGTDTLSLTSVYKDLPVCYTYAIDDKVGVNLFSTSRYGNIGIRTNNTITWGFQPQIQYLKTGRKEFVQFIAESICFLEKNN